MHQGNREIQFRAIVAGTETVIADSHEAHLRAFNRAFAEEGIGWSWDAATYASLLGTRGTRERIRQFWRHAEAARTDISGTGVRDTIDSIAARTNAYFEAMVGSGEVQLREGVPELLADAQALGIGVFVITRESPVSTARLLRTVVGPDWRLSVRIIEDTAQVRYPGVRLLGHSWALDQMRIAGRECVGIEDTSAGVHAANAAGIPVVGLATSALPGESLAGSCHVVKSLKEASLLALQAWITPVACEPQRSREMEEPRLSPEVAT